MPRARVALAIVALVGLVGGCGFDSYCIDCENQGVGGDASGPGGDGSSSDSTIHDAFVPDACTPSGVEVCNGLDEDCDGEVDEDPLPMVGQACGTDVGPCTAGTYECTAGELVCGNGAVAGQPESCNGTDDDCDGDTDEGNPGGGVPCGSNVGECQRGVRVCMEGSYVCDGEVGPSPEVCNGADDDCNGMFDDGNPQGGGACGEVEGACEPGTYECLGGGLQCVGETGPAFEACNGADDDCDGDTDEDYDLFTDPTRCGTCNTVCSFPNAISKCTNKVCGILACNSGYWDRDPMQAGCEYGPCTFQGQEVCNGVDDDCNPATSEANLAPPTTLCKQLGVCAGTVPVCMGGGWKCNYPATASTMNGALVPETNCDNLDNDCNGIVDDAFPARLDECHKGMGACETDGIYVCSNNALTCNAATPGTGNPETCNGKDDDCDGAIDDGAPDNWVKLGSASLWVYQYEASRPDATDVSAGSATHRSCSNQNVMPWTNVTYDDAQAACAAAGGRLCTEDEWEDACRGPSDTCNWSYASSCDTYSGSTCNGNDYDFDAGTAGVNEDGKLETRALASCRTVWTAGSIYDLSGNVKEWTEERADGVNPLRGGSFNNTGTGISCDWDFVVASNTFQFENVGFRCCRTTAP